MPTTKFKLLPLYQPWYRYGRYSFRIFYKRFCNKHPWKFRLRMTWQRATRTYSDEQFWNLNNSIAQLTLQGVKHLRKWKHGFPSELDNWETWDDILRQIEEGFQAYVDCDGWFGFDERTEAAQKWNNAMDLLKEWFGALWD